MKNKIGFLSENKTFNLLKKVKDFIKPFKGLLMLTIFVNAIFSLLTAFSMALIKPIFEMIFPAAGGKYIEIPSGLLASIKQGFFDWITMLIGSGSKQTQLLNLSLLIILVFFLKNIAKYMGSVISVKLEEGVVKSIREKLFNKLTSLSLDFFSRSKQGSLISIFSNDVGLVKNTTLNTFTQVLRQSLQIIIYILTLLAVSLKLTLIAFSTSILGLLLINIARKYLKRYATRMQNAMADYTITLQETIMGIRVVKAYNAENEANRRFEKDSANYVRSAVKHRKVIEFIPAISEMFAISSIAFVIYLGGSMVINQQMKADDLILFLVMLFSIMGPIASVMGSILQVPLGIVAAERVFSILDRVPTVVTGTENIEKFNDKIEVQNADFTYEAEPVLKNVSLTIQKHKKIAFVGSSGSGKSTMLDLIIRFYDPQNGEIVIDGQNIREFDTKAYHALFGVVSQETMLFNDTITNNIRYGFEAVTEEDIINAAKLANAYNFIMKLPEGFDTRIGDRGLTISGGERQRIAIARALVRQPQILVFDEATSALDAESEKIVQEAIDASLQEKTAIIVAHRLSTIINCDEIFVFDRGRIVEKGTHKSLIEQNGIYKKLCEIQFAEQA